MPVAPSFQDLLAQGQGEAEFRRPDLAFLDGDVSLAQLHAGAAMADAIIRFGAQAFKETFLDGAKGDALTALVKDHLNLDRQLATQAQATVEFTRTSGGAGGTIPQGTVVATQFDADGKEVQFSTDADFIVGVGLNGPFSVAVTAVNTGRDGNVAAGTIERIVDSLFDTTFSVTNPDVAGGGNNEESDESLRERARAFFTTLRRGTLAALEFGAKLVPTVRVATAIEDEDTGLTTLIVSDSDGNSTAQMIDDVIIELENWRAAGSVINVTGGVQVVVDLELTLTVRAGYSVAAANDLLEAAVQNRMDKLVAQETLYLDSIIAAVIAVAPDDIFDVAFDAITVDGVPQGTPANVVPTIGQVIRLGTVTFAEA